MGYETYQVESSPPWLRGPFGEAWNRAQGQMKDAIAFLAKEAVKSRLPRLAPSDALPYLASERSLPRAYQESEAAWRLRLEQAFELWALAGTEEGVRRAVAWLGYAATTVYGWQGWPQADDPAKPWRFMVAIQQPHPWTTDGLWSDPGYYDDGGTWDSTATVNEVNEVRQAIELWAPRHALVQGVAVIFAGAPVPGTGLWSNPATWGSSVVIWNAYG